MREYFLWLESIPMRTGDLLAICFALVCILVFQQMLTRAVRSEAARRARSNARIEHWFVLSTYRQNRDALGADHPLTQELGIALLMSWRRGHPNLLQADLHGDGYVQQAMEEIRPISEMRM